MKINIKKYLSNIKLDFKNFFDQIKKLTSKDLYKSHNIAKANIDLGIYHLKMGNINDAIFRFYIVSRFFDKSDENAKYLLAWAYFIKKDLKRSIKEIQGPGDQSHGELSKYLLNYKSCDLVPDQIVDTYKNFTSEYIYGRYFTDKISLSKLLVDELLTYLKTIPKDFKILDLGCKSGLIGAEIDHLINRQYLLYGCESNRLLAEKASILANKNNVRIYDEILNSDIEDCFNETNIQYDVIIAFDSLSYKKNLQDLFVQVKATLRKNGCFILLLKKSDITQISSDMVSFEYKEADIKNQLSLAQFSIYNVKSHKMRKNDEYFIIIAI